MTVLDLLHPQPVVRADPSFLRETIAFAFATGDVDDVLERVVDEAPLAPSLFDDEQFARDVFLVDLVQRCFKVSACGQSFPTSGKLLVRLLGRPPRALEVAQFRQAILRELVGAPELRAATERLYVSLRHLRDLLTRMGAGLRIDPNRRRLEVLRTIVEIVRIGCSFARAESGLRRIGEWATAIHGSQELARIVQLLAYEDGAAELDLRVRIGYDGRIRDLVVLGRREPVDNPFFKTAFGRFAHKLSLMLRGERFSDDEVLTRLVDEVFSGVEAEVPQLFLLLGDIEVYLAALSFRDSATRAGLAVCLAELTEAGDRHFEGLFNPLLIVDGGTAVPCDLHARGEGLVIVTGPNSGGKTRLLQAVALTQLLGEAGLFVPARAARLPRARGLFVSLIEQARADQREGRLGTELLRIRRLFERVEPGALVVLDELCAGTNPSEGEEIFRLVVKLLAELRPTAFITTHLLSFASRLEHEKSQPLDFLQVELDADERPTYQFVPGVATTSLAHRTAARLGVTEESLRRLVRSREAPDAEKSPAPPAGAPKREGSLPN